MTLRCLRLVLSGTLILTMGSMLGFGVADGVAPADDANALVTKGLQKLKDKQFDDALECFRSAAEKSPSATTWALAGDCLWLQRKLEDADAYYRRALEVDPNHCGANHALGRDAVLLKRYDKAIRYLEKANALCEGSLLHAQNLRFCVEALLGLDKVELAESYFKKLRSAYPCDRNTAEAGLMLAVKKGDESAAEDYRRQLREAEGTERQAKEALDRWHEALTDGDVEAMRELLAEDAIITDPGGGLQDRDQLIGAFRSGVLKVRQLETSELEARGHGEVIVASYRVRIGATVQGQDVDGSFRYTTVFAKRDGKWRVVASHGTVITGP